MKTGTIIAFLAISLCLYNVNAFSKEYYEKKGLIHANETVSGMGATTNKTFSKINGVGEIDQGKVKHLETLKNCAPELLEIGVYNDRKCTQLNEAGTKKAQLSDKQKKRFEDCQELSHGKHIYGKVDCKDDGFYISIYTDKECTRPATKGGKAYHQSIYYGRCHHEKDGSRFYFKVTKQDPVAVTKAAKAKAEKLKNQNQTKDANATKGANSTKEEEQLVRSIDYNDPDDVANQGDAKGTSQIQATLNCSNSTNCTKKEDAHFDLGGGFDHEIGNSTAAPVEEEKPVVNEVDTKALKNEKPVEKKKKEPEGDGYSHAQPEHIHVQRNSGSFNEALKEYYVDEANKEKQKFENAKKKQMDKIKEEEDRLKAIAQEKKDKEEAARQEMIDNDLGDPNQNSAGGGGGSKKGKEQKSAELKSMEDKLNDINKKRQKELQERKSESLSAELDQEFEQGSVYDKRTEKAIVGRAKKKAGLLAEGEETGDEWLKVKHNDYIYHEDKKLTREDVIKIHNDQEEEKKRLSEVKVVAAKKYNQLGVRHHHPQADAGDQTSSAIGLKALTYIGTVSLALLTVSGADI